MTRRMSQSSISGANEDLTQWKPIYNITYAGYKRGDKTNEPERAGRVIIHMGDNEHIGGYYIYGSTAKMWYKEGYIQKVMEVPVQLCTFTKRREENLNVYDVLVDIRKLNLLYGTGENMAQNDREGLIESPSAADSKNIWTTLFKSDPRYWKGLFQKELDTRWHIFDKNIEHLTSEWKVFKKINMEISETGKNAETYKSEWAESLSGLGNLINKITEHEKGMWAETQRSRDMKTLKVKQKFKDSDVDEIRFNNMMEYIEKYPELQAHKTIERAVDGVKEKREEVIAAEKAYRQKIKETNVYLNTAKSELQRIDHQLTAFESFKTTGESKMNAELGKLTVKIRSVFWDVATKENMKLYVFEFDRKIEESRDQLKLMKEDLKEYEKMEFKPIVTKKFADIED